MAMLVSGRVIVGLGWWFGDSRGTLKVANPFHVWGFQESKPPTHKPTINH